MRLGAMLVSGACALGLSGCALFGAPPNVAYVDADEETYKAVEPYTLRKVAEDEKAGALTAEQAEIKRKLFKSWKARIDAERKAQAE